MDRDFVHYFHDFGDDGANSHSVSLVTQKDLKKFFLWCIVLAVLLVHLRKLPWFVNL